MMEKLKDRLNIAGDDISNLDYTEDALRMESG